MKKVKIVLTALVLTFVLAGCSNVSSDDSTKKAAESYTVITDTITADTQGRRITVTQATDSITDTKVSGIKTEYTFVDNKVDSVTQYITYKSVDDAKAFCDEALQNVSYSTPTQDGNTVSYIDLSSSFIGYNFYDLYNTVNVNGSTVVAEK